VSFLGEKKGWVGRNVELAVKVRDKSLAGHLLEKILSGAYSTPPSSQGLKTAKSHKTTGSRLRASGGG
jgi:hypothetical protein